MIGQHQTEEVIIFNSFSVNLTNGTLLQNGIPVSIEPKPFQVLVLLLREPGRVIRHEEFKAELWPDVTVEVGENLATQINKLRKALAESGQSFSYICTRRREGYQFNPSVHVEHKILNVGSEQAPGQPTPRLAALSVEEADVGRAGTDRLAGNETEQPLGPVIQAPSSNGRIRMLVAVGVVMVCIITVAAWWWTSRARPENPVRFKVEGSVLTAFDRNNRQVWNHSLPNSPSPGEHAGTYQDIFVDLDGDGRRELLYIYIYGAPGNEPTLYCFNRMEVSGGLGSPAGL